MATNALSSGVCRPVKSPLQQLWVRSCFGFAVLVPLSTQAGVIPGEGPALGPYEERTTQDQITSGRLDLREIRRAGLKVFATPFNHYDGYGDGPMNPLDPTRPGGRPMLGNNGTMLRVNGMDTQTCLECHSLISADTVPATLGVGGAGGISTTALFQARYYDVADSDGNGFAAFDGRAINPLSLLGAGGVQLLAKEMTADLQRLKKQAVEHPGTTVRLYAKGVHFGEITYANGSLDTSGVEGIDADLVVRPFGRKGEFSSLRAFDLGATQFHMGIQPQEVVGEGVDGDGDDVADELLVGEISALEIFIATMERPEQERMDGTAKRGFAGFQTIGCAECHRPLMETEGRYLDFAFPEVPEDPAQNVFYRVDLSKKPTRFEEIKGGGLAIELFSDLKRHDMGEALAESFHGFEEAGTPERNGEFITAKLWGVADTAPYLHDGRALTLYEAIYWHGGEAGDARDAFLALPEAEQGAIIAFLRTLRNPDSPNKDVIKK